MPSTFPRRAHWLAALLYCALPLQALGCPEGQQEVCLGGCFCLPVHGPIQEQISQVAAPALQGWIQQSRDLAIAGDTRPIPLDILARLEPYYDSGVLSLARYKIGNTQDLSAAEVMLQNPDVNAVTLIDVIVFRSEEDAQNDVALWAHELKHVEQYRDWGVREFALRYTRDHAAVEAPAYEIQRQVAKALKEPGGKIHEDRCHECAR
ncbi:hypothetical protein D9M68_334500 [compost metagenome]